MYYLLSFLVSSGAIFWVANSHLIDGIILMNGYVSALIFAVVLGLVNLFLGTLLRIISFPLRLITLGLFSFVISAIIVKVTDELVPGVTLIGFLPIIIIALITSTVSFVMKVIK